MDYFTLFGLSIHYNIDMKEMSSCFKKLQRQYHPDKFSNRTQAEQTAAVLHSTTINQAWQTLRNPLTRAEYILLLHGFNIKKEQRTIHDAPFLIEQLELREELNKIKNTKDNVRLEKLIKHVKNRYDNFHQKMVEQLNAEMWEAATDTLCKLSFIDKLRICCEQLEENLLNF